MRLENMLPKQLKHAINEDWPLLVPAGCIENHGPHMALGNDTILVQEVLDRVAERIPCVIAPPFWYGVTGYAVSGPDQGTMDMDTDVFGHYAKGVLRAFLEMGFQKILVVIHHQGSGGPEGLALQRAAGELMFEKAVAERGRAWWGRHLPETHGNAFSTLRVLDLIRPESGVGGDHAGFYETAFLRYLRPELVDMNALSAEPLPWFCTRDGDRSEDATVEEGKRMVEAIIDAFAMELSK